MSLKDAMQYVTGYYPLDEESGPAVDIVSDVAAFPTRVLSREEVEDLHAAGSGLAFVDWDSEYLVFAGENGKTSRRV